MQSTGQASTQAVSFVPMQGSAMTYVMNHLHRLSRYAFRKMNSTSPQLPKTRDPMIRFLCDSYLTRTALRFGRCLLSSHVLLRSRSAHALRSLVSQRKRRAAAHNRVVLGGENPHSWGAANQALGDVVAT